MLVEGISVTRNTYEEAKGFLIVRYGDTNRITQAHLKFLEGILPAKSATTYELNTTFIECHRLVEALREFGITVTGDGRVFIHKILRAFPREFCQRQIVHVNS